MYIKKGRGKSRPYINLTVFISLVEGVLDPKSEGAGLPVAPIAQYQGRSPIKVYHNRHPVDLKVQSRMGTQGKNIVKILDQNNARSNTGIPAQPGCPVEFLMIGVQDGEHDIITHNY